MRLTDPILTRWNCLVSRQAHIDLVSLTIRL